MKLWQKIIKNCHTLKYRNLCRGGFSKQNAIKSHLRASLKLDTLDASIWVSLSGREVENMDWRQYFSYGATWGIGGFLVWMKYYKKFKLFSIHLWKNVIWDSILCERIGISQTIIWCCPSHQKAKYIYKIKIIKWTEGGPIEKEARTASKWAVSFFCFLKGIKQNTTYKSGANW